MEQALLVQLDGEIRWASSRAMCEVWVEKADGTVTAIGTASAVVPRAALGPAAAAPAK